MLGVARVAGAVEDMSVHDIPSTQRIVVVSRMGERDNRERAKRKGLR